MKHDAQVDGRGRFAGRRALVLGGSNGIGRAVALALARAGASVLAVGRDRAALADLAALARLHDLPLRTARADRRRAGRIEAMVTRAGGGQRGPDLLIHAMGDYWEGPLSRLDPLRLNALLESNLTSVVRALRAVLPPMRRRRYGRVILFGAVGADAARAAPRAHAYRAAKLALLTLARSAAVEEAEHGITINVILPGIIRAGGRAREFQALARGIPARRLGTPQEVARAALFLLAEESGYITGTALHVGGGLLL